MKNYLLGLDIGGTKCAAVLGEKIADGVRIIDRRSFLTASQPSPEKSLRALQECVREILSKAAIDLDEVDGMGISCGGPLDSSEGVILGPPNLPGWDEVPIVSYFESAFGLPARLENDADASALAEWQWGAGRGSRNMIFLTFGTGLGAGLILNGELYRGAQGLAGEVGHVRLADEGPVGYGKAGSFEGFCSGGGIARLARMTIERRRQEGKPWHFCQDPSSLDAVSAQTVAAAARQGDPVALEILDMVARRLGAGLAILSDILDPEVIVIGSIFARNRDLLWPIADEVLRKEALSVRGRNIRVVPAELGEQIGDYAALAAGLSITKENV